MPRRRVARPTTRPLRSGGEQLVEKCDGRWYVRDLAGSTATRTYTCPACLRPIPASNAHVVAWPEQKSLLSADAVDERRHWHTSCWARRN